jgi:hypothetical protein
MRRYTRTPAQEAWLEATDVLLREQGHMAAELSGGIAIVESSEVKSMQKPGSPFLGPAQPRRDWRIVLTVDVKSAVRGAPKELPEGYDADGEAMEDADVIGSSTRDTPELPAATGEEDL